MKMLLPLAAGTALLAIAPAAAQPTPPMTRTPQVELRTQVRESRMPQTRAEVVEHVRALFARFDTNRDGFITQQELAAARQNIQFRVRERMNGDMGQNPNIDIRPDPNVAFNRIDANHDGVISRAEFINAQPQMMKREFRIVEKREAGMPSGAGMAHAGGGQMLEHLFMMADSNHDGRLSIDEATNAALRHFDMADTNHDGVLSPEERMNAHRMMMEKPPR